MKLAITSLFSLMLLLGASPAFAQETTEPEQSVDELKALFADLKEQVDAGDLTKEDAQTAWDVAVSEARERSQAHYENRIGSIEDRISTLQETNPEAAADLQARLDNSVERRSQQQADRAAVRAQVESGELTREEGLTAKRDLGTAYRDEVREDAAGYREDRRVERVENSQARDDQRLENTTQRIDDREAAANQRIDDRGTAADERLQARDDAFNPENEALEAKSDAHLEARGAQVDANLEQRSAGVEERTDTREENVNTRYDARTDARNNLLQ